MIKNDESNKSTPAANVSDAVSETAAVARAEADPAEPLGPCPAWLEEYPDGDHDLLRRHGVDPAVHPDARAFNARVLEAAASGLTGEALAEAADRLGREYIGEEEAEEDLPEEVEWEIERQIDEGSPEPSSRK